MSVNKATATHEDVGGDILVEAEKGYISALDDPSNPCKPVNWSKTYKWSIVGVLSAMRLTIVLGTLICAPAAPSILADLGSHSSSDENLLVSIWELGEACGPLLVAPLSELFGRVPIYNVCNVGFVAFSIGGALSHNIQSVMVFRFFQGFTVASIVLDPSVIGDLFVVQQRGKAMAIGSFAALIGPMAGPAIGGYISETIGWRWTFWIPAIMGGVSEMLFIVLFRETYWPQIVRRETKKLRKYGQEPQTGTSTNQANAASTFRKAIIRPVMMLWRSPLLLCVATYVAVVFGYMYLILTSIEEAFQDAYGWSTGTASLAFISNGIGVALGVLFCQTFLDKLIKSRSRPGEVQVEGRIIPMAVAGVIMPAGLILYGWGIQYQVQWVAPMAGLALVGFGMALINIPAFSYLVDAFGNFAASAIAASITLRCITGAVIPIAGPSLYGRLGQGWGNSVLGLTSLAILPVPVLLIRYGERLRGWSGSFE